MTYEIDIRGRFSAVCETQDKGTLKWVIETAKARDDVSLIRVARSSEGSCRVVMRTLAFENGRWVGDLGDFL